MERHRDLRRASVSSVNGLPKRRQRISCLRDSTDEDQQMELQETVRLRDRERLHKKDRDRELPKIRRVERSAVLQRTGGGENYTENESADSSHDEYYEEDEIRIHQQNRLNQPSPTSSSLSNFRRGMRTLRSSPLLRAAADEMLGFPVPRRARSASSKRLHEYWNSGSGGFAEDLRYRRFSPSPATVNLTGSGGASSSSSGSSMKKKMKSAEGRTWFSSNGSNTKPYSVVPDDIDELEVAEALFDLMKQSQPHSQSCQKPEKVDGDSTNTADDVGLKRLKAEDGKDENNAFSVQNEQSINVNAETIVVDSIKEPNEDGRIEKEKFPDDPSKTLASGDGFVNKGKVGSPEESESPSSVKVNACDIQDPTVTKADYASTMVEDTKEAVPEIDLMAPLPFPSTLERDALKDVASDQKVMTQIETISKDGSAKDENIGGISSKPWENLGLEKPVHDITGVSGSTSQQKQPCNEQKIQPSTSLLTSPFGMSGWPNAFPQSGYMQPLQAVLPLDGSARSSVMMLPPPFKFSQTRQKRCATHQYIAQNIQSHQQQINKSLSSAPTGPATLYGTSPLNLNSMLPAQKFIRGNASLGEYQARQNLATISSGSGSGKDKSYIAASASNVTSVKPAPQQASHQAPTNNLFHGPGFIIPLGHHQTTMMAPVNSSGPPQLASAVGNASLLSNSADGRPSVNLPGGSAAVSFNHPMFSSNESAPFMAMVQNNGCSIPVPSFKGGAPSLPFFNSSFYSSPTMFNISQNQQQQLSRPRTPAQSPSQNNSSTFGGSPSHKQPQGQQQISSTKVSDNKFASSVTAFLPQPDKLSQPTHSSSKPDTEINKKSDGLVSYSVRPNNVQTCSFPIEAMNFAVIPPMSTNGGAVSNKHGEQGNKGRVEFIPPAFALSFGSNASTPVSFSSMVQNSGIYQMLPEMAGNGNLMAHQKNFQISSGGQSFNFSKSGGSIDISAVSVAKFDDLARTISSFPSTSAQTSGGVCTTIPSFQQQQQQQQLIQLQKHHMHQIQLAGTAKVKSFGSQVSGQTDNPKWESFPRTTAAEGSSQSANSTTYVNVPHMRSSQGPSHITFGNQNITKSQPVSPLKGSIQDSENGPSQKTSPACRRIVPSILSTCPTQLSELKY